MINKQRFEYLEARVKFLETVVRENILTVDCPRKDFQICGFGRLHPPLGTVVEAILNHLGLELTHVGIEREWEVAPKGIDDEHTK